MPQLQRSEVAALRIRMKTLGLVVAEVDLDLRYVWIDNPHPDFDAFAVIGKRDDELIPEAEAKDIRALKQEVIRQADSISRVLVFERSDGKHYYSISAHPVLNTQGAIEGVFTVGFEVAHEGRALDGGTLGPTAPVR
jgi:hypothetical protein